MHELNERLCAKTDSYERLVDEHKKLVEEHKKLQDELMKKADRPPFEDAVRAISAGTVKLMQLPSSQYNMHLPGAIFIRNLIWDIVDLSEEKEMEDIQRKESK